MRALLERGAQCAWLMIPSRCPKPGACWHSTWRSSRPARPHALRGRADGCRLRRRCLGDRHRVEGLPKPQLRGDESRHEVPDDLRRPQPVRARSPGSRASNTTASAADTMRNMTNATQPKAHPGHRRRRLSRLPPDRPAAGRGPRSACASTTSSPAPSATSTTCMTTRAFEFMRHDVTFPLYVEVDEIYNLACPASPIHYQHDPVQTTKTSVHGAINMLGLAKRLRADLPGLHQRGLWRSRGASAARRLLGQRQPDRHRAPATTKASAAPRRCSSTTTASTSWTSRWRASSTPTARACTPTTAGWCRNFIVQALQGRGHHHLRRRQPDPLLLLRGRPDRRLPAPDGRAGPDFTGPVNLGNPGEFTIRQLADKVIELTGIALASSSTSPCPADDPLQRQPDITPGPRADWAGSPRCSCDEGLRQTIAYFDQLLSRPRLEPCAA